MAAADEEHRIAAAAMEQQDDVADLPLTEVDDRAARLPYRPTMRVAERIDIIWLC